jgi:hypothetical protein
MTENIQKIKENFEDAKVRYNTLSYMLSSLIRSALIELLALGKQKIEFDKGCSFGTVYSNLHKVHIEGIHFDEHGGTIIDCLDYDNQLTTCHINDMKFTTDEKYQFLNELMKHIQSTDNN